jgi:hypothetical protein
MRQGNRNPGHRHNQHDVGPVIGGLFDAAAEDPEVMKTLLELSRRTRK